MFDLAGAPIFGDDGWEDAFDDFWVEGNEHAGLAFGEFALGEGVFGGVGELKEAEVVADDGDGFTADARTDFIEGEVELFAEFEVGGGDFDGVEVAAFDVFDEGDFEFILVAESADDGGNGVEASDLTGAPTTLTGDDGVRVF